MKVVDILVNMPPVVWKRPGGKSQRYDMQVNDKAAWTAKALAHLRLADPELTEMRPVFKGHVKVSIHFYFENKNLFDKSDLDNLQKFAFDALQSQFMDGILWHDDKQIVSVFAEKILSKASLTEIKIIGD